jgi:hypothetical protein
MNHDKLRLLPLTTGLVVALFATAAWPLASDNDQPMDITANNSKSVASRTGAASDPDRAWPAAPAPRAIRTSPTSTAT